MIGRLLPSHMARTTGIPVEPFSATRSHSPQRDRETPVTPGQGFRPEEGANSAGTRHPAEDPRGGLMRVTSVLLNFRAALAALVPVVERVGMAWKRPEAYDEWDAIAMTLFDKLVVEVLRSSLDEGVQEGFQLPPYDLSLSTYARVSTLEVIHSSLPQGRWLFHAFGTDREPFDVVEVRPLSEDGRLLAEVFEICPLAGAEFRLRLSRGSDLIEEIEMVGG